MQIFVLDYDIPTCAEYHCNKHVVSAIKEHCQLLSTCHFVLGSYTPEMLVPTHPNHPCAIWLRKSVANYKWLCELTLELLEVKRHRFDTPHMYELLAEYLFYKLPNIPDIGLTEFAKAMPERYIVESVVQSYRNYYIGEKSSFARWTHGAPSWFISGVVKNLNV